MTRVAVAILTAALFLGGTSSTVFAKGHGFGLLQHARIGHHSTHDRHHAHHYRGGHRGSHRLFSHSLRRGLHHGSLRGLHYGSLRHRPSQRRHSGLTYRAYPPATLEGCRQVSKIGRDSQGRRERIGGTLCHDEDGRAYIAKGSRHVIAYLP